MRLAPDEVERFYRIWFPLLHFVNQQRRLVPSFPATWGKASVLPDDAVPLRDALWADDALREAFIAENPVNHSPADLDLVASWEYRVSGQFFVFRYLKKHTVFLTGEAPVRAYGVLGLASPIEAILGPYLPTYVQAVLLPFEGRIIYDSLLSSYAIHFGGGIRRELNDSYRHMQEREGIITSLVPSAEAASPERIESSIRARNKRILTAFQKALGHAGLSPRKMELHTGTIDAFAHRYLLSQSPPRGLLEMTVADVNAYLRGPDTNADPVSFRRFVRFLRDTGRMDEDEVEALLDLLRRRR